MHDLPEVAEPLMMGLVPPLAIVSTAMIVLILIMLWKRVPAVVASALDKQIVAIREQFAETSALRAEAEALRASYAARIANAEKDAADMLAHARHEAGVIVERAEIEATAAIARREKMAHDKIAAAQNAAIDDLRRRAVTAATEAATQIITARYGAEADRTLVDGTISRLAN